MSEILPIRTRVQKIGDHCAGDFLSKGKITAVDLNDTSGYVTRGVVSYTVEYDSGSVKSHLERCTLRLESDPPYSGPFAYMERDPNNGRVLWEGFHLDTPVRLPRTPLSEYSKEELEAELERRKV
jgi:hypothetical protein